MYYVGTGMLVVELYILHRSLAIIPVDLVFTAKNVAEILCIRGQLMSSQTVSCARILFVRVPPWIQTDAVLQINSSIYRNGEPSD